MTGLDRFDSKWIPEPNTGCWLWIGSVSQCGYGDFWYDGRLMRAHRFAYERLVGPIAPKLSLDHLCRVRCCVNPAHLDPVPLGVNTRRSPFAVTTILANKTHCNYGHPFDEKNTYINYRGHRVCRICRNFYANRRYHVKRGHGIRERKERA